MAHDVFISYASEDKTVADAICAILEGRSIRCWIAPRDVRPGVVYSEGLIDALESSRLLVLVLSSYSNKSPHVMREVETVVSKGIPILPFRIEDIEPSKAIRYFIGNTHWLDALTPPMKKHIDYLADNVQLLLRERIDTAETGGGPTFAFSPEVPDTREPLPNTSFQGIRGFIAGHKHSAVIVVGLLLVLAVGAYILNLEMAEKQAVQPDVPTSISGPPSTVDDNETTSVQQSAQAETPSPTSNQVSIPETGVSLSQNTQVGVPDSGQAETSTTIPAPTTVTTDFDKSKKLAAEAYNLLLDNGDPKKVRDLCDQAIELNPQNDFAYEIRGCNYFWRLNLHGQGFRDLGKAIECKPENPSLYYHRGQMYAEGGSTELAINDFKKALSLAERINDQTNIYLVTLEMKKLEVPGY